MGTRHLICVVVDEEYKVAQYGQFDGYPSGQGQDIADFIKNQLDTEHNIQKFIKRLNECTWITDKEYKELWEAYSGKSDGFMEDSNYNIFCKHYPQFYRSTGAKLLGLILLSNNGLKLKNHINFAKDSLFCEYGYVIDMDNRLVELYEGFNKSPLDESARFNGKVDTDSEYYPIKKVAEYSFDTIGELPNYTNVEEENDEIN